MYDRILVPLDGSKIAENVIPYAEEFAARLGSEIILISVSDSVAPDIDQLYRPYLHHVTRELRRDLKECGVREEAIKLRSEVLLGKPVAEIMRCADKKDVGLIIVPNCGSSGRGPWLLGNITTKVLRATSKPVLFIRPSAKGESPKGKRLMQKILAPLDGSKQGESALPHVEVLAKVLGAKVVLIEVFDPVSRLGTSGTFYSLRGDEGIRKALITYPDSVARSLREKGLNTSSVVVFGSTVNQIISYAEENAIDLIAMPSHRRSHIRRWVFSNIADKILPAVVSVSMLIVPTRIVR